jgi:phosphoglycerate dehydrogenase-like enzyme
MSKVARAVFALVSDVSKNPAMAYVPELLKMRNRADFIVGNRLQDFESHPQFDKINAIVWVPPAENGLLASLWKRANNSEIKWLHCGFAGIDAIHPFILEHLVQRDDVVVTNAKGAYSRSLAEYAMCATLHFEKQVYIFAEAVIDQNRQIQYFSKIVEFLHVALLNFIFLIRLFVYDLILFYRVVFTCCVL